MIGNKAKRNILIKNIYFLLAFTVSQQTLAQQPAPSKHPDIQRLSELLKNKQFLPAYELSKELIEEWGGDPDFDFLAGRAAFRSKHYQEAVFAFERVLIVKPHMLAARVFLAFSYFRVNNYGAAQKELTKLLKEELPERDAAQVRDYLQQITAIKEASIKSHDLSASVAYSYDSNVNSGTSAERIDFPILGEVELFDSSRETADEVAELSINYGYREKLTQQNYYQLGVALSDVSHKTEQQLDRTVLNLTGGYVTQLEEAKLSLNGFVQPMLLDDKYYRIATGSTLDASWSLAPNWQWLVGAGFTYIDNQQTDNQDIRQYSLKSRFTYIGDNVHIIELGLGDDQAILDSGLHNGKDFWLLNYTYIYPLSSQWLMVLNASYQDSEYDAVQPSFGIVREEQSYIAGLNLDYTPLANWRISFRFNVTDKQSNLEIYEYDRASGKVLVSHTF